MIIGNLVIVHDNDSLVFQHWYVEIVTPRSWWISWSGSETCGGAVSQLPSWSPQAWQPGDTKTHCHGTVILQRGSDPLLCIRMKHVSYQFSIVASHVWLVKAKPPPRQHLWCIALILLFCMSLIMHSTAHLYIDVYMFFVCWEIAAGDEPTTVNHRSLAID